MTAMQTLQTQSRRRGGRGRRSAVGRDGRGRFSSRPRRVRSSNRSRRSNSDRGRGGGLRRASRPVRRAGRRRSLPERDERGRFVRRKAIERTSFVSVNPRPAPVRERRVVKRRWWRVDGPQDPNLPKGYTYADLD